METIVRGACPHDCPDTCALESTVSNGRVIKVQGAKEHRSTAGVLCTKVSRYPERTYHAERILKPLKRVGAKGSGEFVEATWDEAMSDIAQKLRVIAQRNPEAILPYSYAGTMGLLQGGSIASRFFHTIGASLLDRTICASAGATGLKATYGASVGMSMYDFEHSDLIILWGTNPITSNLHLWSIVQQAKRRGAILIAIDPYASDTATKCHHHLAIQPGTDGALALGIIHYLIQHHLLDRNYIEQHTSGFDALAERAASYTPDKVASITGLSSEQVVFLAQTYGVMAQQKKAVAIRLNYGMQRAKGGGNAVRAIACLPSLVGAWRQKGGGLLLSSGGLYPSNNDYLERPDLLNGRQPRTINMSDIGNALLGLDAYQGQAPVEAIVVYNSNPVAVAPESSKVVEGFAREDLFVVVLEHFKTDTADYADWILPATTQLEHLDIHKSYGHSSIIINNPAIAPLGAAKPNTQIFRELALAMGLDEVSLQESDLSLAQHAFSTEHPYLKGYDFQTLRAQGWYDLQLPELLFANGGFMTRSGKCEFVSSVLAEQGLDPVPDYIPPYEAGFENASLCQRFPFAVISPPARNFLNSSFVNIESLQRSEKEPCVWIHPEDANTYKLKQNQTIVLYNDRGEQSLSVLITDRVKQGVLVVPSIWWRKLSPDGKNANELTSQRLTDLGRAPTFYDTRVAIKI